MREVISVQFSLSLQMLCACMFKDLLKNMLIFSPKILLHIFPLYHKVSETCKLG